MLGDYTLPLYTIPAMRVLITAGPTREPIDPVRFVGNRSSGLMGKALTDAALKSGHSVTLILGPVTTAMPENALRIDVETSKEMHDAVLTAFPKHDLLIMSAAVADYRPKTIKNEKVERSGTLVVEFEPTEDIVAAAGKIKRPDQRTIGFSLVKRGDLGRSMEKLVRKHLDLIVYNSFEVMGSKTITSVLLWPDGQTEELPSRSKGQFADILLQRAVELFQPPRAK
jgi:phosphopantothenoylcysteine decarboxylase/phosphopantothenate--cysteine ligase